MKRTEHQKRVYAWRRLSIAVDRVIVTGGGKEWPAIWAKRAKLRILKLGDL